MIDTCPCCRYSLEGLPDRHACPECGFQYERDSVVFEESRSKAKTLDLAGNTVFFLLYAAISWVLGYVWVSVVCAILIVASVWRSRLPRRMIIVSPFELRLRKSAETDDEVIPMEKVAEARWSWAWGSVSLLSENGETIRRIPVHFLGSNKSACKLASAINEFRRKKA